MRKRISLLPILLCLFCMQPSSAQVEQRGIVLEYNERNQKTPLANVEILVTNANSTISDKDGKFILTFRTRKPGDKVIVRRIEKLGYEIFNKEALEEWNITSDTHSFVIIMCEAEKFKRIRDNYYRISSESYAKQLKIEEEKLSMLKQERKIKKEEYESALNKLRDLYEVQLDNIHNYVDKFARIDLSELSEKEAEIIQMVECGNLDEAIAAYEAMNLEENYAKIAQQHRIVSKTVDSLSVIKKEHQEYKSHLDSLIKEREILKKQTN